jgi:hypothetical protein
MSYWATSAAAVGRPLGNGVRELVDVPGRRVVGDGDMGHGLWDVSFSTTEEDRCSCTLDRCLDAEQL